GDLARDEHGEDLGGQEARDAPKVNRENRVERGEPGEQEEDDREITIEGGRVLPRLAEVVPQLEDVEDAHRKVPEELHPPMEVDEVESPAIDLLAGFADPPPCEEGGQEREGGPDHEEGPHLPGLTERAHLEPRDPEDEARGRP